MKIQQITFTKPYHAEITIEDIPMTENSVCVKTMFSSISCGTERANLIGDPNVNGAGAPSFKFPRCAGYSSSGIVVEVGKNVTSVKVGDRVAVHKSNHRDYNIVPEDWVVKIEDDRVSLQEAALNYISTFPMAAVRKTRLELGEPAMVMGLGILGQFAVIFARQSGACPLIAADPVAERREEALRNGADFALDPLAPDFAEQVKALTDGGVAAAIEVTGVGAGLDETLDCMRPMGRVALLGCTRDKNFTIDYYRKVHFPGIELLGAHTCARPDVESYPGHFTHRDDIKAFLKLCAAGRIDVSSMIKATYSPADCTEVYSRLAENYTAFPIVAQFDWSKLEG